MCSTTNRFKNNNFIDGISKCHYCHIVLQVREECQVDHVKPKYLGGQDIKENFVLSCISCNQAKKNLSLNEFKERILLKIRPVNTKCRTSIKVLRKIGKLTQSDINYHQFRLYENRKLLSRYCQIVGTLNNMIENGKGL